MIRALIVDDEKITRKGMISVIPWARFGIEIVGDVGSGPLALAFLERQAVDLVFVDVAMPGMTGIELIRELRARGHRAAVVVLTFYDEFEYVQEALRMGALDYVLKTDLDDEKIRQMLERVTRRLAEGAPVEAVAVEDRYLLVAPPGETSSMDRLIGELPDRVRRTAVAGDGAAMIRMPTRSQETEAAARRSGVWLARVTGAASLEPRELLARHGPTIARHLFYVEPAAGIPDLDIGALGGRSAGAEAPEAVELARSWSSTAWVLDDETYRRLGDGTVALRPPLPELREALDGITRDLERTFAFLSGAPGPAAGPAMRCWADWRGRLGAIRDAVKRRVVSLHLSDDVARKVLQAVDVIRGTAGRHLKEETVATRVGLSRSYFSQLFKDLTGVEFKRHLVDKSIAEASHLLIHTNLPFRGISIRLGYQNEGYFSRMFRSATGMSPRVYRARSRAPKEQA